MGPFPPNNHFKIGVSGSVAEAVAKDLLGAGILSQEIVFWVVARSYVMQVNREIGKRSRQK